MHPISTSFDSFFQLRVCPLVHAILGFPSFSPAAVVTTIIRKQERTEQPHRMTFQNLNIDEKAYIFRAQERRESEVLPTRRSHDARLSSTILSPSWTTLWRLTVLFDAIPHLIAAGEGLENWLLLSCFSWLSFLFFLIKGICYEVDSSFHMNPVAILFPGDTELLSW